MRLSLSYKAKSVRWLPVFVLVCTVWFACIKSFASGQDMPPATLLAKYTQLVPQLRNNQFQRGMYPAKTMVRQRHLDEVIFRRVIFVGISN